MDGWMDTARTVGNSIGLTDPSNEYIHLTYPETYSQPGSFRSIMFLLVKVCERGFHNALAVSFRV